MARQKYVVGSEADLPAHFRNALEITRKVDPNAVLAGGALRDTVFGREVKDIDIFVGPGVTLDSLRAASGPGWVWENQFHPATVSEYRQFFGETLVEVIQGFDSARLLQPAVQVVVMKPQMDVAEVIHSLDFGFCQIGTDDGLIVATDAFILDRDNKTATLTRSRRDKNHARSLDRARRLARKYPDFTFITDTP